jgi:hypothetical protein
MGAVGMAFNPESWINYVQYLAAILSKMLKYDRVVKMSEAKIRVNSKMILISMLRLASKPGP